MEWCCCNNDQEFDVGARTVQILASEVIHPPSPTPNPAHVWTLTTNLEFWFWGAEISGRGCAGPPVATSGAGGFGGHSGLCQCTRRGADGLSGGRGPSSSADKQTDFLRGNLSTVYCDLKARGLPEEPFVFLELRSGQQKRRIENENNSCNKWNMSAECKIRQIADIYTFPWEKSWRGAAWIFHQGTEKSEIGTGIAWGGVVTHSMRSWFGFGGLDKILKIYVWKVDNGTWVGQSAL